MRPLRPFAAAVLALVAAVAAGCTAAADSGDTPSPFAACAALVGPAEAAATDPSSAGGSATSAPSPAASSPAGSPAAGRAAPFSGAVSPGGLAAGSSPAGPAGASGASRLSAVPDVTLPCFTGGKKVALRSVRGPAVINLWASWCGPCRHELPVMQQLADKAGDKISVVGVDTGDGREAGASFAAAAGVTFPTLFDPDRKLLNALAAINLPVTVFVDVSGKAYVNILPLDAAKLSRMVREHAGVAVTL